MRILSFVLFFVLNCSAFAANHIGERAVFDFTQDGVPGTYSVKVLNREGEFYNIETTMQVGDQRQVTIDKMKVDELMTHQKIAQILQYCSQIGGTPEILTIKGKRFQTCKLNNSSARALGLTQIPQATAGFVWAGDTPILGVVKMQNDAFELTIRQFHWN